MNGLTTNVDGVLCLHLENNTWLLSILGKHSKCSSTENSYARSIYKASLKLLGQNQTLKNKNTKHKRKTTKEWNKTKMVYSVRSNHGKLDHSNYL